MNAGPQPVDDPLVRYSRHLRLPEVGVEGQERLGAASVLVVGAGGLGSPALLYLAAAGVGTIGVIDSDVLELSNLQRQVVHDSDAVGTPKVHSAAQRMHALNPHVLVREIASRIDATNALEIVGAYDVIIDGSDNFPTRYLLSDACVLLGKPLVYGSVLRFEGQASVFVDGDAPCYRCLYPEPPAPGSVPDCERAGVLGVLPGLVGTIQATEALKLLLGTGRSLAGRLLLIDASEMSFREITVDRDPACPACGARSITALVDYDAFCGISTKRGEPTSVAFESAQPAPGEVGNLSALELAERLARGERMTVVDVREEWEWQIGHLPEARHIPLNTVLASPGSVVDDGMIVLYCHHGGRSLAAAHALVEHGVERVWNLDGGIDRWSLEVDPSIPRY
ncbi:MAG TPA: molybdopterin-synthase adenylyltransferase MoeB [Gemmatimonadaceae bacterium]|nr:molybdopterin-synthase adenylyltransferase MoeB [Gemmatimonadaceae bacterium]